jgi:hypothetical protein
MKIGDLVKNLNSESRMTGIIVGWTGLDPVVLWADGRRNRIVLSRVEVVR